jgi:hypothetical protein
MCPGKPFVESVPQLPEHENQYVDVSHPGRTGMHYVARISHWMQKTQVRRNVSRCIFCGNCTTRPADPTGCKKHRVSIMCPDALLVECVSVPPELEK